jgi:hypothetical protein
MVKRKEKTKRVLKFHWETDMVKRKEKQKVPEVSHIGETDMVEPLSLSVSLCLYLSLQCAHGSSATKSSCDRKV